LLGKLPVGKQLQLLSVALLAFLAIAVVSAYFDNRVAAQGTATLPSRPRLLMLSQAFSQGCATGFVGKLHRV